MPPFTGFPRELRDRIYIEVLDDIMDEPKTPWHEHPKTQDERFRTYASLRRANRQVGQEVYELWTKEYADAVVFYFDTAEDMAKIWHSIQQYPWAPNADYELRVDFSIFNHEFEQDDAVDTFAFLTAQLGDSWHKYVWKYVLGRDRPPHHLLGALHQTRVVEAGPDSKTGYRMPYQQLLIFQNPSFERFTVFRWLDNIFEDNTTDWLLDGPDNREKRWYRKSVMRQIEDNNIDANPCGAMVLRGKFGNIQWDYRRPYRICRQLRRLCRNVNKDRVRTGRLSYLDSLRVDYFVEEAEYDGEEVEYEGQE